MIFISAEECLFSGEKGVILGGSDEYFALVRNDLLQLREEIKRLGRHGKQLSPQNISNKRTCERDGCEATFEVTNKYNNAKYCSLHRNGKGGNKGPNNIWWTPERNEQVWALYKSGHPYGEIALIAGRTLGSIQHRVGMMKKREYRKEDVSRFDKKEKM